MTCPHCAHPAAQHGPQGCEADDVWSGRCPCECDAEAVEEDERMAA